MTSGPKAAMLKVLHKKSMQEWTRGASTEVRYEITNTSEVTRGISATNFSIGSYSCKIRHLGNEN